MSDEKTIDELIIEAKEATGTSDEGLRDALKDQGINISAQSVTRWRTGHSPHKGSIESVTAALEKIIEEAAGA